MRVTVRISLPPHLLAYVREKVIEEGVLVSAIFERAIRMQLERAMANKEQQGRNPRRTRRFRERTAIGGCGSRRCPRRSAPRPRPC
jgi:hypothetical protein